MPMKRTLTLCLCLAFLASLNAQKFTLSGTITDSLGAEIELGTVILLNAADSVMAGFSISNAKGKFKIDDLAAGEYLINITYLGYADYNERIDLKATIELAAIALSPLSTQLTEITVSDSHVPMKIKKDTIVYNADAFKTQAQDNVEQLLKRLPGMEVGQDGSVKAQGETVQKILVDGKEFFGKDPQIATKNLPADAIASVEVFDEKSDMAQFSGIDDGQREKTINLILKDGKKAGYFGNMSGGLGTDKRLESNLNINRFTKKTQISAIGMYNNTNKQGFSFNDYISFMGGIGNAFGGGGRGGRGNNSSGVPIASGLGDGIVTTGAGGVNLNVELSPKVKMNNSYFTNNVRNTIDQESFRQNLLVNGGFTTEQESLLENANNNHTLNSTIRAEIDSSQNLIVRLAAGVNVGNSTSISDIINYDESGGTQSSGNQNNTSEGDRINLSVNTTYMKKLQKRGRFFTTNLVLGWSDQDQLANLNNQNLFNRPIGTQVTDILQNQNQNNAQTNYNVKLSFTEPLGKRKYLEMNVSRSNFSNDFEKIFYDLFPGQSPAEVLNTQLSNAYNRDFTQSTGGINFKVNKNTSSLTVGAAIQHSALDGLINSFNPDLEIEPIERRFLNILPSLSWNKEFGPARSMRINYNTNINEPSLEQLQPIIDNSDPLNIYIGNPELNTSYRHRVNINYNSFSQFSNTGFFVGASANYTLNPIVNSRFIDEFFVQTTTPINTANAFNSNVFVNFNTPLKLIRHRVSINNNTSYDHSILFVNNQENRTNRYTNSVGIRLDNSKKKVVDLAYGFNWSWNKTSYDQNSALNQSFSNYSYFTELNLDLPKSWAISTDIRSNIYSQEDFGDRLTITRWQANISKILLPSKKLRLSISAFDLLNQNQNINRTSNINFIEDSRIVSIGRYFMFTAAYSFSGFGAQQNAFGSGGGRFRG